MDNKLVEWKNIKVMLCGQEITGIKSIQYRGETKHELILDLNPTLKKQTKKK